LLGSVSYLNAKPLLWGLEARLAPPSQLARWLRAGEVEAALVPIVEAMENPVYWLVDGVAIGCDGPVYSVILTLSKPLAEVRTVALDAASKTSVRLMQWLLERHYGLAPHYVADGTPADAQLRIGDPAIAFRQAHPSYPLLDLGEAWKAATGLPFVFAVWALRAPDQALADRLREAARAGLARRAEIAREPWEYRYLTESIRYELGGRQREAIARFAGPVDFRWL
jgi:chorismate dehydratase